MMYRASRVSNASPIRSSRRRLAQWVRLLIPVVAVAMLAGIGVVLDAAVSPTVPPADAQVADTIVYGSTEWEKGPKLCPPDGGAVGIKSDDWTEGYSLPYGFPSQRAFFAYVYMPSVTTSITPTVSIEGRQNSTPDITYVNAALFRADVEPTGSFEAGISSETPAIPDENDGPHTQTFAARDVTVATPGWYRLQVHVSFTWGWYGDPPAKFTYSIAYSGTPPCEKDKLELACVCNPAAGLVTSGTAEAADPITTGYGSASETAVDLSIPARGGNLGVSRSYTSLAAGTEGPLGFGWSWDFGTKLVFNQPGSGEIKVMQPGGAPAVFSPMVVSGGTPRYQGPPWVTATLVDNGNSTYTFTLKNGTKRTYENAANGGRLTSIENRFGYQTGLTYNGDGTLASVTDVVSNRSITFGWNTAKTRITTVTDQATPPRTVNYGYDTAGNLEDVVDVAGNRHHYGYDGSHRLTRLRAPKQANPNPQVTTKDVVNVYDSYGRVTSQTDNRLSPARVTTFNYNAAGLPAQDPNTPNGATLITVKEVGGPDVYTRVDHYNKGQRTKVVEGTGTDAVTRLFNYDPSTGGVAKVETQTSAGPPAVLKTEAATTFNWKGDVVTFTDAIGRTVKMTSNSLGQPLTVTDPAGVISTRTYDTFGNPTSSCQPISAMLPSPGSTIDCNSTGITRRLTTMGYDPSRPGDLLWVRDPSHHDASFPDTSSADASNSDRFEYDPSTGYLNSASSIQTPESATGGNKTTYQYDSVGRLQSSVGPKGNEAGANPDDYKSQFVTNAYGDITRVADPLGAVTEHHFDANHNIDWNQPADGNCTAVPAVKCTLFEYNDADQMITVQRPEAGTNQSNEYTADGRLKVQRDGLSNATTYTYDSAGRPKTVSDPNNRVTTYFYDNRSRMISRQEQGGNCGATPKTGCVTYGLDDAGRATSVTYSDGVTPNIDSITYDTAGRRLSATTKLGSTVLTTTTFTWDSIGRMRSSSESGETMTYRWDPTSNLTKIGYPGGDCDAATPVKCVTRGFDAAGRLTSVTDWNNQTTNFRPDEHDNYDQVTFPTPTTNVDNFTFDRSDRLMGITYKKGAATTASLGYDRDVTGKLTKETRSGLANPGGNATDYFGYDANSRLCWQAPTAGTSPTCAAPPSGAVTWKYDGADNLTKKDDGTGIKADPANQLCYSVYGAATASCTTPPAGATTYGYDSRGNRTTKTPSIGGAVRTDYGYDQENRLTAAAVPAQLGNSGEYTALNPARIYDSRASTPINCSPTCTQFAPGDIREIQVTGQGGVPATNVSAVVINLLAVGGSSGGGYLTAYSSDLGTAPETSNLNYGQGQIISNGAVVKVGANGKIKIRAAGAGPADVIVDIAGAYSTWLGGAGGTFTPLDPQRGYDSRAATPINCAPTCAPIAANSTRDIQITGIAGVPSADVATVTVNLTVSAPTQWGKLVAYATDSTEPTTTSLNFNTGQVIGELNVIKVGTDGKIRIKNGSTGTAEVIVDVLGWSSTTENPTGSDYIPAATPKRIYDSRSTNPVNCTPDCTPIPAGTTRTIQITGLEGVPAGATAVAINVTALDATGPGFITVYPSGTSLPNTSTVNFASSSPIANGAIAKLGADGKLSIRASANATNVIVDVNGWYINARNTYAYTYNAGGLRQTKATPIGQVQFVWSYAQGMPLLAATKFLGQYTYFLYGPGGLPYAQLNPDGSTTYLHHDQLGSTRLTTNSTGDPTGKWTFNPYGSLAATELSATATPLLYTSQYLDAETSLYYLRARLYDPTTGQFISRDPIGSLSGSAYGYVHNNPLNHRDPSGLIDLCPPWDSECWGSVVEQTEELFGGEEDRGGFVPMDQRDKNDRYYDDDYEQLSGAEKAAVDAKCEGVQYDEKLYNSGKQKIKKSQKHRDERAHSGSETNKASDTSLGDNLWPDNITWGTPIQWVAIIIVAIIIVIGSTSESLMGA